MGRATRLSSAQLAHIAEGPHRPVITPRATASEFTEAALAEVKRRGYRLAYKRMPMRAYSYRIMRDWAASTSVIGRKVYVGHGFRVRQSAEQAITLWHEIVHIQQQLDLGLRFYFRYVRRTWRATFEAEATVTEILAWEMLKGKTITESQVHDIVSKMYLFYRLQRLDRAGFIDDVVGAVMCALRESRTKNSSN